MVETRKPPAPSATDVSASDATGFTFEARWPMRLALIGAIALYATLPDRVIFGPRYIVPALEALLLAVLFAISPKPHHSTSLHVRGVAIALVALVTASNITTLVLLCRELLHGQAAAGRELVVAAIQIWVTNVIAFGFWYWELDRGGPVARLRPPREQDTPDFLFPQMSSSKWAPAHWRPLFIDYLYTSFTNATAFSPTDTMPLSPWAKLLMAVQSGASLITVALVAARAVNILT